jgi:hypothetical protein
MKSRLNEVKKLQKLAGLLKESQLNESQELLGLINKYIRNAYTLDQGYDYDADELIAEQESIKSQIETSKGEAYFKMLDDFANTYIYNNEYASPKESPELQAKIEDLAMQLGFTIDQLTY